MRTSNLRPGGDVLAGGRGVQRKWEPELGEESVGSGFTLPRPDIRRPEREELLFRGALLSGMRRDLPAHNVIAWQALLFGAVHASIYRFLPTACVGAALAALTLRTRRLWPAVILHTTYNAILVLELIEPSATHRIAALALAIPGALLMCGVRPTERAEVSAMSR